MLFPSTRGIAKPISAMDMLLTGTMEDGGLAKPDYIPRFTLKELRALRGKSYSEVVLATLRPYTDEKEIPSNDLRYLIKKAYHESRFPHPRVAPVRWLVPGKLGVLELFHSPTWAFKDFPLQLVGLLFDYVLGKRNERTIVVGATTGDTGPAAINATQHKKRVKTCFLAPWSEKENRALMSRVQWLQMATCPAENITVATMSVPFGDLQRAMKAVMNDTSFAREYHVSAMNSVNLWRPLIQVAYIVWLWLEVGIDGPINVSVPCGNAGNLTAVHYARRMGVPIKNIIIATTDKNDVLARVWESGTFRVTQTDDTLAPAMDIDEPSNIERVLADAMENPAEVDREWKNLKSFRSFSLTGSAWKNFREGTLAGRASNEDILATIKSVDQACGVILDPHCAVAIHVARQFDLENPTIALGTAHFAKFQDTVERALGRSVDELIPKEFKELEMKPQRFIDLAPTEAALKDLIVQLAA